MLFKPSGGRLQRLHGPFSGDEEVQNVVGYWKHHLVPSYKVSFADWSADGAAGGSGGGSGAGDVASGSPTRRSGFCDRTGQGVHFLIQRRFKIGFNRAANMVEQLEADGIIGPADGSKPRAVVKIGGNNAHDQISGAWCRIPAGACLMGAGRRSRGEISNSVMTPCSLFSAEFEQKLTHKESGAVETRYGTLHFKKPLLIRWETKKPIKETPCGHGQGDLGLHPEE